MGANPDRLQQTTGTLYHGKTYKTRTKECEFLQKKITHKRKYGKVCTAIYKDQKFKLI